MRGACWRCTTRHAGRAARAAVSGRLSLGVPDDYAVPYLTPVLRSFASRHAAVEILLVCEQSTALIPKVGRGELDLAVVTRDRPQRGELLFREPLVWVGSAAARGVAPRPAAGGRLRGRQQGAPGGARRAGTAAARPPHRLQQLEPRRPRRRGRERPRGGRAHALQRPAGAADPGHAPQAAAARADGRRGDPPQGAPAAAAAMHEQIVRTLRRAG